MKYLTSKSCIAAVLCLCFNILCACGHTDGTSADKHEPEQSLTTIHIDSIDRIRLGIETETVKPDTFHAAIKLSGQITPSAKDNHTVSSPSGGVVRFVANLHTGMKVDKGELLATVDADAVSGTTTDRVTAAELSAAKRNLDRMESLRSEGLATVDELNEAVSRYRTAVAAHSSRAASGRVTSPAAGVITQLNVTNGESVTPGQTIAAVTSGGKVTVVVDVPERHAPEVATIDGINILMSGDTATRHIPASMMNVDRGGLFTDARGYIPLSLTIDNPGTLRTGAFADIYLLSRPEPGVLSVPRGALIEDQGSYFVYVALNEHEFERRKVEIGNYNGRKVKITKGIHPGERVAVKEVPMLRMAQSMSTPSEGHHHH